jgi:hypothetical protein
VSAGALSKKPRLGPPAIGSCAERGVPSSPGVEGRWVPRGAGKGTAAALHSRPGLGQGGGFHATLPTERRGPPSRGKSVLVAARRVAALPDAKGGRGGPPFATRDGSPLCSPSAARANPGAKGPPQVPTASGALAVTSKDGNGARGVERKRRPSPVSPRPETGPPFRGACPADALKPRH